MRKAIFLIVGLFLLSQTRVLAEVRNIPSITPSPAASVDYALPYPGLLPDHPLYFLKNYRDNILLWFTRDPVKKSQLNLLLADKHLAMGQLLWEKQNYGLSISTITFGEQYLLKAAVFLTQMKKTNSLPPGFAEKFELAARKHQEIINKSISAATGDFEIKGLKEAISINNQAIGQINSLK